MRGSYIRLVLQPDNHVYTARVATLDLEHMAAQWALFRGCAPSGVWLKKLEEDIYAVYEPALTENHVPQNTLAFQRARNIVYTGKRERAPKSRVVIPKPHATKKPKKSKLDANHVRADALYAAFFPAECRLKSTEQDVYALPNTQKWYSLTEYLEEHARDEARVAQAYAQVVRVALVAARDNPVGLAKLYCTGIYVARANETRVRFSCENKLQKHASAQNAFYQTSETLKTLKDDMIAIVERDAGACDSELGLYMGALRNLEPVDVLVQLAREEREQEEQASRLEIIRACIKSLC